jgi:hypothetical protein
VTVQRLTFIITMLGTLLAATCAGSTAALLTAAYVLGVITTELARREQ